MKKIKYFLAKAIVRIVQRSGRVYDRLFRRSLDGAFRHLGSNARIETPFDMMNPQCISIGDHFIARAGVKLRAYTSYEDKQFNPVILIGDHVHLAAGVHINCSHRIEIGDYTGLGVGSKVMDHAHGLPGYEDLETTVMKRELTSKGGVIIKRNVMIGTGVVILAGVEIGENAIIGSNSVVTRSIPANSIAVGIPARVIKTLRQ